MKVFENLKVFNPTDVPKSQLHSFDGNKPTPIAHSTLQMTMSHRITPESMGQLARHRFTKTLKPGKCNYCANYMFSGGLKCKECKYRCHQDCESQVPPSCGEELLRQYINQLVKDGLQKPSIDSLSNNSSRSSSAPSSPAGMHFFTSRKDFFLQLNVNG